MFWQLLYNMIVIPAGWIVFEFLGLIDGKARRGVRARRTLFERLEIQVGRLDAHRQRVWFHSSSMGEFEQAKPVIAALKKRRPDIQVIVSFFSPSGYEHSLNYKSADLITYIPFDFSSHAERFVGMLQPDAAVIVRYDVWPNHLRALQRAGVPTFIANATLQSTWPRKLPVIRGFLREMYNGLDYILTVSESDKLAFEMFRLDHPVLEVVGDTRFDQVGQRSAESRERRLIPGNVIGDRRVLVIGSSWPEDEEVLLPACVRLGREYEDLLIVIVPHEPTIENLERVEKSLDGKATCVRFSNLAGYHGETVVLVDSVGILMALYQYAHIAFVGGSFRQGVHNVLEPAAYGIPVIIGPKHENSQEAVALVRLGIAVTAVTAEAFVTMCRRLFDDPDERDRRGSAAYAFVHSNMGATERFLSYLDKELGITTQKKGPGR